MKSVRYFIWVIIPLAVFLAIQIFGFPYIRWSTTWRDDGQGFSPLVTRWYLSCFYLGFNGSFSVYPRDGNCPLVRFEKINERGDI